MLYGTCEEIQSFHGGYKPEFVVYNRIIKSQDEGETFPDWLKRIVEEF